MSMTPQILLRVSKRTQIPLLGSKGHNRVIHRDIKSANILLDENTQ
jgi:serine/threonine protein kinase